MLTVAGFYFVATSNLKAKKQVEIILWTLVAGTSIASVISILSYFGAYLPFDFAQIRSFNTLGIVNRLALLQAFVIPITVAWTVFSTNKNIRVVSVVLTLVLFFSMILINFFPAYLAAAAGLAFLALGGMKHKLAKSAQGALAVLAVFGVLFLVMRFIPQVAKGTLLTWINVPEGQEAQLDTPKELRLSTSARWNIATQAIGKRPLFGTGPATFSLAYTQLKPRYINGTDQRAVRFDKPASALTEITATTGI